MFWAPGRAQHVITYRTVEGSMNYRELALEQVQKAVALNKQIAERQANALALAPGQRKDRATSQIGRTTADEYYAAKILEGDFWYKALCSSRDGAQALVQMYGMAALLEDLG